MAALLGAVLVLLLLTATLTVSAAEVQSPVSFLLGIYVVVWAEVVCLTLGLSIFHAFGRTGLLIGSLLAFATAATVWTLRDRPRVPALRPALRHLRAEMADPVLGILAATAVLVIAYAVVLGVATPQNEWDSLTYHLTRAALWIQQGAVSYAPHVSDIRLNANPPNAEIGQAWTMLLGGNDRFVWLPSLSALLALMLGIFGVARRAGLEAREALFGALIFASLPLVALQSSTAMNDLVVASFFVAATYFAIGTGSPGALGAGLSLGLAFGTKVSAPLLFPIFLVVVLVARRRRLWEVCAIVIMGVSLGAFWYIVNLAHTGALDGGLAGATDQGVLRPALALTGAYRLLLDTIELPGAWPDTNRGLFLAGATMLALAAAIPSIRGRHPARRALAAAGGILFITPFFLTAEGRSLTWAWRTGWVAVGRRDLAERIDPFTLSTLSDSSSTWYGPVGALLVIGGVVIALSVAGNRRPLWIALAVAPLVFVVVLAVGVVWDPWRGRFFVFPIALAATTWGLAYRVRAFAWAAVGLTVVTVVLVLVNSYTKPLGVRMLAPAATPSVFGKPRWRVQTWTRNYDGTEEVVSDLERHVPRHATVGLSLRLDDFSYPFFGAHLHRTVRFLAHGESASADESWIVEAPGHDVPRCVDSWETVLATTSGFHVLRRAAADPC